MQKRHDIVMEWNYYYLYMLIYIFLYYNIIALGSKRYYITKVILQFVAVARMGNTPMLYVFPPFEKESQDFLLLSTWGSF